MSNTLTLRVVHEIRDNCLCFATQSAARRVARRFDRAFQPLGLTNNQFSLLAALMAPRVWRIGDLANFLAMDRTSLTANLKALERRGLVRVAPDARDKRVRAPALTEAGRAALVAAEPIWRAEHAALAADIQTSDADALRSALRRLG